MLIYYQAGTKAMKSTPEKRTNSPLFEHRSKFLLRNDIPYKRTILVWLLQILALMTTTEASSQDKRARDMGIEIGVLRPGKHNAITDVEDVKVGHTTLIVGDSIRTGVTAILPHSGNIFQLKVPGAIYIGNGFGKLVGYSQVKELGNIETPIILTNTLSVPRASDALISYTLNQKENKDVRSVNSVVGETNDGVFE